jgi:single-strand DNA-binding protein
MLNKIMLIGNLGKDPEFNVTPDGTPVAKFTLAVNRNAKNRNGEWVKETEWFNIVAWRQVAERCEKFLHKGSKVYIEGRLTQRKYTDRENISRTSVEVIVNDMQMLDPRDASGGSSTYERSSSGTPSYGNTASSASDDFDPFLDSDDLP